MAQNLGYSHGYYAIIETSGMAWSLRVNDLFLRENGEVGFASSNGNITPALLPGLNRLTLQFAPLTGEQDADGNYISELRDGLLIDIAIQRIDYGTREEQVIDVIGLRYDLARGAFEPVEKTPSGADRVRSQPLLRAVGDGVMSDGEVDHFVFRNGQIFPSFRLDVDFEVDDPMLPPFVWAGKAVPLTDTPEVRRELFAAYERLHDQITRGEKYAILEEVRPVWERAAYVLTSHMTTAEEFINDDELGLDLFRKDHPDGSVFQPLRMRADPSDAALQFMDGARLVRFRPDPIVWALPPGDGPDITSIFPVVFYKTPDGEWRIGDINVGL